MARYLVVSDETDSVVAQNDNLETAVRSAAILGYHSGYVTNQDGASGDLWDLIERYGFEDLEAGEEEEDLDDF